MVRKNKMWMMLLVVLVVVIVMQAIMIQAQTNKQQPKNKISSSNSKKVGDLIFFEGYSKLNSLTPTQTDSHRYKLSLKGLKIETRTDEEIKKQNQELQDIVDFHKYYDGLGGVGVNLNFGAGIASIGSVFGWNRGTAHAKAVDKFFSNALGGVFDAPNWDSNICLNWFSASDKSTTVMVSSSSKTGRSSLTNGAYLSAKKSSSFIIPNETNSVDYKYYFIDWFVSSKKRPGLKVDVKVYKSNGESESILPEVKELGATIWKPGVNSFQSQNDYVKVCLEFQNSDLSDYFDFYSLDDNKLCQTINSID